MGATTMSLTTRTHSFMVEMAFFLFLSFIVMVIISKQASQ